MFLCVYLLRQGEYKYWKIGTFKIKQRLCPLQGAWTDGEENFLSSWRRAVTVGSSAPRLSSFCSPVHSMTKDGTPPLTGAHPPFNNSLICIPSATALSRMYCFCYLLPPLHVDDQGASILLWRKSPSPILSGLFSPFPRVSPGRAFRLGQTWAVSGLSNWCKSDKTKPRPEGRHPFPSALCLGKVRHSLDPERWGKVAEMRTADL